MDRPEYLLKLTINERRIIRVVIDQHYKGKHPYLDDQMILEMLKGLDGQNFPFEEIHGDFSYFKAEPVFFDGKPYRLILLLSETDNFLGVVNAFRVPRRKI
ncbi:MAG: hypothetical protein HY280_02945 [Nitrospinae bacterium]|nr:hypothetical protein [Nitrospinota bacterium]